MKKKLCIIIGILIAAIFIGSCTNQKPKIELSAYAFNLGEINPDDGIRTETFYIKNTGSSVLKIAAVSTSCGCTKAEAASSEVLPGEQTELVVEYDPNAHPEITGQIKRIIYIKSNDPLKEEVELEITGNQLSSEKGSGSEENE